MKIQTIALALLNVSALNVRPSHDDDDIDSLAADIAARGLLAPLVVHETAPGTFAVIAGGRRLRALDRLLTADTIAGDYQVPVMVAEGADAELAELSLAENVQRRAMHPAEEARAFQWLIREGSDEAGVARRFGITEQHVKQRLRLADLAPVVFDAFLADQMTLDAAKAYGSTADQTKQAAVFEKREKVTWGAKHDPNAIRKMLAEKTLGPDDDLVRYVGLEAYEAAGGAVERDIFDLTGAELAILDVDLVQRLAREKAEAELPALVKLEGVKAGLLMPGLVQWGQFPKIPDAMVRQYAYNTEWPAKKKDRKPLIAIYAVADGQLKRMSDWIRPMTPQEIEIAEMRAKQAEGPVKTNEDWERERRERQRDAWAEEHAARAALKALMPTFEDAFYTRADSVHDAGEGNVFVQVSFEVTADQLARQMPAAFEQHDARKAVLAFMAALALELPEEPAVIGEGPESWTDGNGDEWTRLEDGSYVSHSLGEEAECWADLCEAYGLTPAEMLAERADDKELVDA